MLLVSVSVFSEADREASEVASEKDWARLLLDVVLIWCWWELLLFTLFPQPLLVIVVVVLLLKLLLAAGMPRSMLAERGVFGECGFDMATDELL